MKTPALDPHDFERIIQKNILHHLGPQEKTRQL